jgi:hypothetical protein
MAEGLQTQEQDPAARELSFEERFGLLVDQQWNWRENQALKRARGDGYLRAGKRSRSPHFSRRGFRPISRGYSGRRRHT